MSSDKKNSLVTLLLFVALTTAFYGIGYWLIYRLGKASPLMLSVGAAAVLTMILCKRDLRSLGWHWGPWKYQWMSYALPLAIVAIAYGLVWLSGAGGWYDTEHVAELREDYNLANWNDPGIIAFHFLLSATVAFALSLPAILGEEIAWRGFLVPELSKFMRFTGVALVSGILWAVWHWPIIILGLYGAEGTPLGYQLGMFTLYIVSISTIMAYLRMKSGSLWTAVIFHMSANIYIQQVFTPLTHSNGYSAWFIDEFGALPALAALAFAVYFWRKGVAELDDQGRPS